MSDRVAALVERYAKDYMAGDAQAIAGLCEVPFLAVRRGATIHLADRAAVVAHFEANMAAYRATGAASAVPAKIDVLVQGDMALVATVAWEIRDAEGAAIRAFTTSYQLVADPLRILSYVNHDVRPTAGS